MFDSFPEAFINESEFPKEEKRETVKQVIKDFYDGKLTVREIRYFSELFKTKDIEIGTHASSGIKSINEVFGSVWAFIEKVPIDYSDVIEKYLSLNAYNQDIIDELSKKEIPEIITDSIKYALNADVWSRSYYSLHDLYAFSKYVSLDELFLTESEKTFVEKCGFENLIKYNEKNNGILEVSGTMYSGGTLLQKMAEYAEKVELNSPVTDVYQLQEFFSKIIYHMRIYNDYSVRNLLEKNRDKLSVIFPDDFLDYSLLNELTDNMDEEKKKYLLRNLESGFNGDTKYLVEILNKRPDLIPLFVNKKIIVDKEYKEFYEIVGNRKFLEVSSKYGNNLTRLINNIGVIRLELLVNKENYEKEINQYIYDSLNSEYGRNFDIRLLPESFKKEYPELFISDNAPRELQNSFYGRESWGNFTLLNTQDIQSHPEWIPFLMEVDLKNCLAFQKVNAYSSKDSDSRGYSFVQEMNLYEALSVNFSKKEILEFISKYGKNLLFFKLSIDMSLEKKQQYDAIIEYIYKAFKDRSLSYNIKSLPKEFIEKYPDIFLSSDAPEELQNLFYQRQITPDIIKDHPEWKPFLLKKDISAVCDRYLVDFVKDCEKLGLDNNILFGLFEKYGSYLLSCSINIRNIHLYDLSESSDQIVNILENVIENQIATAIIKSRVRYDEEARSIIGDDYPELFLSNDAPEELKEVFYNYSSNTPLSFELLKQHKEWLPYLRSKNVLLSLQKKNVGVHGLELLFEKYGDEEALRIGLKNPESVMMMLSLNEFNTLSSWYDKLHFIPHHIVMREFPFDQADKFIASGKKWSQLMRIERHNVNDDAKSALLKASMCFGVFDNDMEGFNKTMQLFAYVPKKISAQDYRKMLDFIQDRIALLTDNPDTNKLEEYSKQLEMVQKCYGQSDDGTYLLKINPQQDKTTVQSLRQLMEESDVSTILTADKAHKLFGGFIMKYDPDFRDFIIKNMDVILSSDEYISYISSMQKQWKEIRAVNSNLVLTLDLAMAFIKTNSYIGVQTGNVALAEKVSERGYSQADFERLQQIYNYGKTRVFSTIPSVQFETEEYVCEMIRLDDPIALVVGKLTGCCQELGNAAESCMTHSAVDKTGRIFYIRDKDGRPIAQSWVWRNKNVLCFDNIEIPEKAFTSAVKSGLSREEFTDKVYSLYQRAGQELMDKDEIEFKKLLDEGKITEEQYEALKIGKVTVGLGYNDIKESLMRNAVNDSGELAEPLPYTSPIDQSHYLYSNDHQEGQYIIAGDKNIVKSDFEAPAIYSDEFEIHDDNNTDEVDLLTLEKLELTTKGNNYNGQTQLYDSKNIVSSIAYNYDLNPRTTKIIMNANFAIIYEENNNKNVIGDILYNTSFEENGKSIDITDKVTMQIRMALEQIREEGKEFDVSRLGNEQQEMYNKAMNLDKEIDEERGLSHGSK